jgi:predicted DNA-binding protein (MmcQ/YjbR family)
MNVEEIRSECLSKSGCEESFPFGGETLVFKVQGKIFLLLSLEARPPQFNVKCDPTEALSLREKYPCVLPGYHMNKKHWNTVICDGSVAKNIIFKWIDQSYLLVSRKIPLKERSKKKH